MTTQEMTVDFQDGALKLRPYEYDSNKLTVTGEVICYGQDGCNGFSVDLNKDEVEKLIDFLITWLNLQNNHVGPSCMACGRNLVVTHVLSDGRNTQEKCAECGGRRT